MMEPEVKSSITGMNVALSLLFRILIAAAAITKPVFCAMNVVNKQTIKNNPNLKASGCCDVRKYTIDTYAPQNIACRQIKIPTNF